MREQLSFDLPARTALGRDDFFVAPSNHVAVALVEDSQLWPNGKLVLCGPEGSGKTHLAHVWAAQSGARLISATELTEAEVPALAAGPLAVEDVPLIAEDSAAQNALFHLHNLILANGHRLMLTGRGSPRHWHLGLPDLQSRMDGTQAAQLEAPDDHLLSVVLAKLFADRQITPKPDVIPYLVTHMDRSFGAAQSMVDRLDRATLQQGRGLTRRFVSQLLGGTGKSA